MKEAQKFIRGQKVYCLFLSDTPTGRVDRYGNHLECRELTITRPVYDKEYRVWMYHVSNFSSWFGESELSEKPL